MKKIFTFILPVFITGFIFAQIPNAGFETWSGSDPSNWQTSNNNSASVINVTQVSPGHSGTNAMKMAAWTYQGFVFSAVATCPATGNFFIYAGHPLSFTGWYKSNLVNGDRVTFNAVLQQNNTSIAAAGFTVTNTTSVFQQFTGSFTYSGSQNSDSAAIAIGLFTSSGGASGLNAASYIIIDDLQFSATPAGIHELSAEKEDLLTVAMDLSGDVRVIYSVTGRNKTKLSLYDITGKMIKVLVDEEQGKGTYRTFVSTEDLTKGLYFIRLESGEYCTARKVLVN
jgi:hypothetical protein